MNYSFSAPMREVSLARISDELDMRGGRAAVVTINATSVALLSRPVAAEAQGLGLDVAWYRISPDGEIITTRPRASQAAAPGIPDSISEEWEQTHHRAATWLRHLAGAMMVEVVVEVIE